MAALLAASGSWARALVLVCVCAAGGMQFGCSAPANSGGVGSGGSAAPSGPTDPSNPGHAGGVGVGGSSSNPNTPGSGGTAGNPSNPTPTTPIAGVVADQVCVPLCADASTDPDADGWGYEKGASCVVPGSGEAAARQPCQIGQPLPPPGQPAGSPGVVVGGICVGLCGPAIIDDNADGYGFQFNASCVIPGSNVAMLSLACTTGGALPTGTMTGAPGRLLGGICTRFCANAAADPDADGFGFEFGASCVVSGSPPAAKGIDCKIGVAVPNTPPITLNPNPPPGEVSKPAGVSSRGFFVNNGRLYDKFGNDFVIRGINSPHIWFDISDQYLAYNALANLALQHTNSIRIVWETTGSPALLRQVLRHVVELKMVPMLELHDVTGGTSNLQLLSMANYYLRADVKPVLLDYEEFLLINIANEWSGTDFRNGYQAAVSALRAGGINHTLVIDANGFGQNANSIFTDGPALVTADPQHNLVFSVHMYDGYSARSGGNPKITQTLEQAATLRLALIVGEFAWQGGTPVAAIDSNFIMSECVRLRLGYVPWSWKGNDAALAYLDMSLDWEGVQLTAWGSGVISGANGISQTAKAASIFVQ